MKHDKKVCEDCGKELRLIPDTNDEYACMPCLGNLLLSKLRNSEIPFESQNMPFELPTFNGYTVDKRLRQFRKVTGKDDKRMIEFVEFASSEGEELLEEMAEYFSFLYQGLE